MSRSEIRTDLYILSSGLKASTPALSMVFSQSLTKEIMPPKWGDNTSSMNSWVRAVRSSLKLSDSFDSSAVLSYEKYQWVKNTVSNLQIWEWSTCHLYFYFFFFLQTKEGQFMSSLSDFKKSIKVLQAWETEP